MLLRILANTPAWVWGLLAGLIVLGVSQWRTRMLTPARATVLPAVMTALSLLAVVGGFPERIATALAAWGVSLLVVALGVRRLFPTPASLDPASGRLVVPGSPLPLLLILGIFTVRYGFGVMLGLQPEVAGDAGFAAVAGAVYGMLAGVFAGRAIALHDRHQALVASGGASSVRAPASIGVRVIAGSLAILAMLSLMFALPIGFGDRPPPPPLTAMAPMRSINDLGDLPALDSRPARDGVPLRFRRYGPASAERIAVLVHGSSGDARAMHAVGRALSAVGVAAYALDIRGHGGSGRRGDIDAVGQLEDDLADFARALREAHPSARLALIGHSSGGGFALRFAGGPTGALFDDYLLLAPMLHPAAPTTRPDAGGWVRVFLPRLLALDALDALGLPWFQHLPVLAFALPPGMTEATATYSYRLQRNFRPHEDWRADVRGIARPTRLLVGADDELFVANAYAPALAGLSPHLSVQVLTGIGHLDIVTQPAALTTLVAQLGR